MSRTIVSSKISQKHRDSAKLTVNPNMHETYIKI
jgi:hypothetical protein